MRSKKYTDDQIVFATKNGRVLDLSGQRFGRLRVLGYAGKARWWCSCDCGNKIQARGCHLKDKSTSSCGCLNVQMIGNRARKHGLSFTKIYAAHCNARSRCTNPNLPEHKHYGARDIKYKFDTVEDLLAEIGHPPGPEYTIDRIDTNGNYEPGNVRWVTMDVQAKNKRNTRYLTINGVKKPLIDWAKEYNMDYKAVWHRLNIGWCSDCALNRKKHEGRCPHVEAA